MKRRRWRRTSAPSGVELSTYAGKWKLMCSASVSRNSHSIWCSIHSNIICRLIALSFIILSRSEMQSHAAFADPITESKSKDWCMPHKPMHARTTSNPCRDREIDRIVKNVRVFRVRMKYFDEFPAASLLPIVKVKMLNCVPTHPSRKHTRGPTVHTHTQKSQEFLSVCEW